MAAILIGISGRIVLGTTKLTIGREPHNQLVLTDLQISAYQAEIRPEGQGFSLVDLGSLTGTFVNEQRLVPNIPYTLKSNDHIWFGQRRDNPSNQFTYQLQPQPNPMNPTPRPSIWAIISEPANFASTLGISAEERANLLAPLAGLSPSNLYFGIMAGQALGNALGLKSTHRLQAILPAPYPYSIVVLGCVLAGRNLQRAILALNDTPNGSIIQLQMAPEMWSSGGTLTIEFIDESPARIIMNGQSEVRGTINDWGKGKRAVEELFRASDWYMHRLLGY